MVALPYTSPVNVNRYILVLLSALCIKGVFALNVRTQRTGVPTVLSKMSRQEKTSDRFQEVYQDLIAKGKTTRQALREARKVLAEDPNYPNRRK